MHGHRLRTKNRERDPVISATKGLIGQIEKGMRGGKLKQMLKNEKTDEEWTVVYSAIDRVRPDRAKCGIGRRPRLGHGLHS